MAFPKVQQLSTEVSVVSRALESSEIVQLEKVDGKVFIKPLTYKPPLRNIIQLQKLPADATQDEILALFAGKAVKEVKKEETSWYVIMENEEETKDMVIDFKLKKITFRNEHVNANIKSETPSSSVKKTAPVFFRPNLPPHGLPAPKDAEAPVSAAPASAPASSSSKKNKEGKEQDKKKRDNRAAKKNNKESDAQRRTDARKNNVKLNKNTNIEITTASFPPLAEAPSVTTTKFFPINNGSINSPTTDAPIPTPGYPKDAEVKKYTIDDVTNIVKVFKDVNQADLPASVAPSLHDLSMTSKVNKDLFTRQRTYSIDEAREQLRMGRPVQREAVISGSKEESDYGLLMFGEDDSKDKKKIAVQDGKVPSSTWAAMVKIASETPATATTTTATPATTSSSPVATTSSKKAEKKAEKKADEPKKKSEKKKKNKESKESSEEPVIVDADVS